MNQVDETSEPGRGSSYAPAKYRAKRKARHVVPAEDIPVGELESHYERLCRAGGGFYWKPFFLGLAVLLAGGIVGSIFAGPGWTPLAKWSVALIFLCLLAWRAVDETESEDIKAIREDYKKTILDSIELVPAEEPSESIRSGS